MVTARGRVCVTIVDISTTQSACVISHKGALGEQGGGEKKEGVWAQRKRQSKLLTGSHGNKEETDKGLPRKTGRITTQNTFPFEFCKVLVSQQPPCTVADEQCRAHSNNSRGPNSARLKVRGCVTREEERETWENG